MKLTCKNVSAQVSCSPQMTSYPSPPLKALQRFTKHKYFIESMVFDTILPTPSPSGLHVHKRTPIAKKGQSRPVDNPSPPSNLSVNAAKWNIPRKKANFHTHHRRPALNTKLTKNAETNSNSYNPLRLQIKIRHCISRLVYTYTRMHARCNGFKFLPNPRPVANTKPRTGSYENSLKKTHRSENR